MTRFQQYIIDYTVLVATYKETQQSKDRQPCYRIKIHLSARLDEDECLLQSSWKESHENNWINHVTHTELT